ncbi:unnamed protein product [Dovyalis caffra]|uniref:S-protein homolog n=1 Tax=Dovyalis caffra TaxID=77055 RepID=A0AAV1S1W3_9ROSI|nr:unnamed protein product [Dovyalis caffra]
MSSPANIKCSPLPFVVALAAMMSLFISPCGGQVVVPVFQKYNVHIVNGLSQNKTLLVHCKSKDDDLGVHNLAVGLEFRWSFKVNAFSTTLFWCYLGPSNDSHAAFTAFKDKEKITDSCDDDNNCFWIAKDDGVYLRNIPGKIDVKKFTWEAGRLNIK